MSSAQSTALDESLLFDYLGVPHFFHLLLLIELMWSTSPFYRIIDLLSSLPHRSAADVLLEYKKS